MPGRVLCSLQVDELTHIRGSQALQYQGPQALDAILNYPMYNALIDAFAIPGQQNMSALTDMITQIKAKSTVTKSRVVSTCSV